MAQLTPPYPTRFKVTLRVLGAVGFCIHYTSCELTSGTDNDLKGSGRQAPLKGL